MVLALDKDGDASRHRQTLWRDLLATLERPPSGRLCFDGLCRRANLVWLGRLRFDAAERLVVSEPLELRRGVLLLRLALRGLKSDAQCEAFRHELAGPGSKAVLRLRLGGWGQRERRVGWGWEWAAVAASSPPCPGSAGSPSCCCRQPSSPEPSVSRSSGSSSPTDCFLGSGRSQGRRGRPFAPEASLTEWFAQNRFWFKSYQKSCHSFI